jgi:biopolymer transport protein ExbD
MFHALPQSEINMIPLIDVMLVLLTHAVTIELPKADNRPTRYDWASGLGKIGFVSEPTRP